MRSPKARLASLLGVISLFLLVGWLVSAPSSPQDEVLPPVHGTTYYVAPGGSDHDDEGTTAEPFRTIRHGLEALRAGDELVVEAGDYWEQITSPDLAKGRPNAPIRVRAQAGTRPWLHGLLWMHDAEYWDVGGLNVTWDPELTDSEHMVKFDGGVGWTLHDSELSDAYAYAALLITGDATQWRVHRMYIHDTQPNSDDNQDHLIYMSHGQGPGVISRCVLANSVNGRAIKIGPPDADGDPVGHVTIRYNTMYNNLGPSNVQLSYGAEHVRIYRNILARSHEGSPNVRGYNLEGDKNSVFDNVVFDSSDAVSETEGLDDLGGNIRADPEFVDPAAGDFHARNPAVTTYGRYGIPPE